MTENLPAPFVAIERASQPHFDYTRHLVDLDVRLEPFVAWKISQLSAGDSGYGEGNVLRIVFTRQGRAWAFEVDKLTMETTPADFRAFVVESVRLLLVLDGIIPDDGPDWRASLRKRRLAPATLKLDA